MILLAGLFMTAAGVAALSLLTAAALVVRLGQLGWVVGEVAPAASPVLARFVRQKTVLVTSYRQDGRPVGTPVSLAVDGDHAYLRSFEQAGKTRRLHHNPRVEIAPPPAGADRPARPSRPRPGACRAPKPGAPLACWPPSTRCCTACWCRQPIAWVAPRPARRSISS